MTPEFWATLGAISVALIGGVGGFAALMKVNADNSKVVSEGAVNVVKMVRDELAKQDERLGAIEQYTAEMEVWSERVLTLTEKAIDAVPERQREPFRIEHEALAQARPRRRRVKIAAA